MMRVRPFPDDQARADEARARRAEAIDLSESRGFQTVPSNGEEIAHNFLPIANYAKGLPHDEFGLVSAAAYRKLVAALTSIDPKGVDGTAEWDIVTDYMPGVDRQFESPLAGLIYENQGPDPAQIAMAPAPRLGRSELCAEMAEVYAFAILRDMPFSDLTDRATALSYIDGAGTRQPLMYPVGSPKAGQQATLGDLYDELGKLSFLNPKGAPVSSTPGSDGLTRHEENRRMARFSGEDYSLFYGSSPNAKSGPIVSQFMLMGTNAPGRTITDGFIRFGAHSIDQRLETNTPGVDYMTAWADWLNVQQGTDERGNDEFDGNRHFVTTPRDLSTYVHFDQLYQAYFNACLMLLGNTGNAAKFSPGFPNVDPASSRGNFATFGGPHILSLLTEVATRGLRAVRRQKFQIHRRARPEVIAARLTQVANDYYGNKMPANALKEIESMLREYGAPLDGGNPDWTKSYAILHWISEINGARNGGAAGGPIAADKNYLLPMAFPEGSPMHPAYGAGHATVAGACVTVLKAFFNMGLDMPTSFGGQTGNQVGAGAGLAGAGAFAADQSLTGELDKLAANISIGRNMAGVHYYSDYFDSLRLGERIAAGIIEEQMLSYNERVYMEFTDFDGDPVRIETNGDGTASGVTWRGVDREEWFTRHVSEHLPQKAVALAAL